MSGKKVMVSGASVAQMALIANMLAPMFDVEEVSLRKELHKDVDSFKELENEYKLIQQKKSKLSSNQRRIVVAKYERAARGE